MKTLLIRSLSGLVFAILVIGSMIFDQAMLVGLFSAFTAIGTWEYFKMAEKKEQNLQTITGSILVILAYFIVAFIGLDYIPFESIGILFPLILIVFIIELFRKQENPIQNIAFSILPIFYIGIPMASASFLFKIQAEHNYHFILAFFILMWSYDSFAYLTGVSMGKHRMIERISPKKSWEGFIGGIVLSLGIAVLIGYFFKDLSYLQWAIMSLIISTTGTFGDLIESMFKRSVGVKDSGKIMPGHGGILDRFDAALVAMPFVVAYLYLIS